jgi:hypothetical protein
MSTVVEFIGLCVFTTQVISGNSTNLQAVAPNRVTSLDSQRVVAIMPRVPDRFVGSSSPFQTADLRHTDVGSPHAMVRDESAGQLQAAITDATATPKGHLASLTAGVEPHTAMIMFRTGDYRAKSGWTDADVKQLATGWQYVELRKSDRVAFVADLPNAPVNSLPGGVMHLGDTPLLRRYDQQPYAGAAAIFTIANGALSACVRDNGRIDTTLTLNTRKSLKITAGTKSLTLQDGALVIAANIPLGYADTASATSGMSGASHLTVYCAMQGKVGCAVNRPAPPEAACNSDDGYGRRPTHNPSLPTELPKVFRVVDWSCSNSQWP